MALERSKKTSLRSLAVVTCTGAQHQLTAPKAIWNEAAVPWWKQPRKNSTPMLSITTRAASRCRTADDASSVEVCQLHGWVAPASCHAPAQLVRAQWHR